LLFHSDAKQIFGIRDSALMMLVQKCLQTASAKWPDKTALICGRSRWTFRQLDEASTRLANALRQTGIRRGDRVGIYLGNTVEAVTAIFGILKADAVFVPVHRPTKLEKLLFILQNCQAAALITDARAFGQGLAQRLNPGFAFTSRLIVCGKAIAGLNGSHRVIDYESLIASSSGVANPAENIDLDLACLIYTSGTTGEPKGVMCDHSNVAFVTEAISSYLEHGTGDTILSVLSLAFSYGLYQLLPTFHAGATLVLEDSFAFPAIILQKLAEHRVTGFAGVPTIYSILLGMDLSRVDLSALRYLTNAAAGLPVEHVKRLREVLPNVKLYLMHGLTEVARTMYLPPSQTDLRPGSSGKAMPGTELWLEDDRGKRLGPGETGELVVRGRHVMRGYWGDPAHTAQKFRTGQLAGERVCYSGDLFRTDEEGYFYFVSRKDDIIKSRGEKIAPREIENVLYAIPGVQDAAVIGVPDPVLGQTVKAFIVAPGAKLTETDVISHCKSCLEEVMVPRAVEFRSELPKTGSGKVRRMDLR
jgi:long-chain acyl-CoA synthetase